jgi:hypothetical protein
MDGSQASLGKGMPCPKLSFLTAEITGPSRRLLKLQQSSVRERLSGLPVASLLFCLYSESIARILLQAVPTMADFIQGKDIPRNFAHVVDDYIRAEIAYLDTSTNYREYLRENTRTSVAMKGDELIMLDDSRRSSDSHIGMIAVIIGAVLLLLAAGCFVYMIVDFF